MAKSKKKVRTRKGVKEYTYLGCPQTRNRTAWCFRMCTPDEEGHGKCGRIAPHSLKGAVAQSIENFRKQKDQQATHAEKLEHMYLASRHHAELELGVHVGDGESDVVMPVEQLWCECDGLLEEALCFSLLCDAASLAVNSVCQAVRIVAERFDVQFTRETPKGDLTASGRVTRVAEHQYHAEAVVTDPDGTELARGNGVFVKSEVALETVAGYE